MSVHSDPYTLIDHITLYFFQKKETHMAKFYWTAEM